MPEKILLLSAGSGITPVMAMLRDLAARDYWGDVVFLHVCRNREDFIFAAQLEECARRFPALRLITRYTHDEGRLQKAGLLAAVPDLALRATWMCGPSGMMDWVHRLWQDHAYSAPLHSERFAVAPMLPAVAQGTPVSVACAVSGKRFVTSGPEPLLVQAERAGLAPKHGCRMGICCSCQCIKKSGTVENLQTGEISSAPNELIRICISAARSDIALDL